MVFPVSSSSRLAAPMEGATSAAQGPALNPHVDCQLHDASLVSYNRKGMTVIPSGLLGLYESYGLKEKTELKALLGGGTAHLNATRLDSKTSFQSVIQFAMPHMDSLTPGGEVTPNRARALALLARGLHQEDVRHIVVLDAPPNPSNFLERDYDIPSRGDEPLETRWAFKDGKVGIEVEMADGTAAKCGDIGLTHINLRSDPGEIFARIKQAYVAADGGVIATGCPNGNGRSGVATLLLSQRKQAEREFLCGWPVTKAALMKTANQDLENGQRQRSTHFAANLPHKLLEQHADALVAEIASRGGPESSLATGRGSMANRDSYLVDIASIGLGVPKDDPGTRSHTLPNRPAEPLAAQAGMPTQAQPPAVPARQTPPAVPSRAQPPAVPVKPQPPAVPVKPQPPAVPAKPQLQQPEPDEDIYSSPAGLRISPRTAFERRSVQLGGMLDRMRTGQPQAQVEIDGYWKKWVDPGAPGAKEFSDFSSAVVDAFCRDLPRGLNPFAKADSYGIRKGMDLVQKEIDSPQWKTMIGRLHDQMLRSGLDTPDRQDAFMSNLITNRLLTSYEAAPPEVQEKWRQRSNKAFLNEAIAKTDQRYRALVEQAKQRSNDWHTMESEVGSLQMNLYVADALRKVGQIQETDRG